MFKTKLSLKALGAAAVLGVSALAVAAPATAQTSLSSILSEIRKDSQQMSAEDNKRLQDFTRERDKQAAEMTSARSALASAQAVGNRLSAEFDRNENELGALQAQLEEEAGDFGELLGQFRSAAGEAMPEISNSIANFDPSTNEEAVFGDEGRVARLSEISQARALPTRADLDSLPKAILQEMIAQSEVTTFTANVANANDDGTDAVVELMRVGTLSAATVEGTKFVRVVDVNGEKVLQAFGKQPEGRMRAQMAALITAGDGEVVSAPVDPTGGALVDALSAVPSPFERIGDGGIVGYIILTLLAIGAAIGLFKIFSLFLMGGAMRKPAKTKVAGDGNPLARVFETYETHKNSDIETLELKLDETILQETPRIERFNDIVKVLAAVAPLLGLLGTVIGMIITFTAITIFGAGDPQRMAGGISVALMTTVLGLVAAIPLLLIHAVSASLARGNQQVLDEQAAGLVAERAEREHKGVAA